MNHDCPCGWSPPDCWFRDAAPFWAVWPPVPILARQHYPLPPPKWTHARGIPHA